MTEIAQLFDGLWRGYTAMAPNAAAISSMLRQRSEAFINDHVALRTFNLGGIDADAIGGLLMDLGYRPTGRYDFPVKRLSAASYSLEGHPRVFVSEFLVETLPEVERRIVERLVDQIEAPITDATLAAGLPWAPMKWSDHQRLKEASEYAAWVAAFGLCANHFTVSVNALESFGDRPLRSLCRWLTSNGQRLNDSGGVIKGDPSVGLEQFSTLAESTEVTFAGGTTQRIPGCYVEFALRHVRDGDEGLFDGFIASSADKIFESTDSH